MIGRLRGKRSVADRGGSAAIGVGGILVEQGKLAAADLRAVVQATEGGGTIRETLVRRGLVSEEDAARALAASSGFGYVALMESLVDPAVLPLLGEKVLRKHAALPLRVEENGS